MQSPPSVRPSVHLFLLCLWNQLTADLELTCTVGQVHRSGTAVGSTSIKGGFVVI